MSFIYTTRALFVLLSTIFAGLTCYFYENLEGNPFVWASCGFGFALIVVLVESMIREAYPKTLVVGVGGLLIGLIVATQVSGAIPSAKLIGDAERETASVLLYLFFGYLGAVVALRYVERIDLSSKRLITAEDPRLKGCKILDTSVIIDGRIFDLVQTGFMEGYCIIPKFVLDELQVIADSHDSSRRQRGRRGLDVVRSLKEIRMNLEILEKDYPHIQAVDAKLIQLAKDYEGRIITNDYNLNKVAEIQNIQVLNMNDLSNALKPVILPGEVMAVTLLRPGKEEGQGVGYLDDGTMVVVEGGISRLREEVDVVVTSVLQTAAGRMIFARMKTEDYHPVSNRQEAGPNVVDLDVPKPGRS